ncbi:hypothetical protein FQY83_03520 [Luteimonas marina]|uniref:Uncharacterized protein n=1 Tax=Luteimonas marina TaxID=488485 RepID=A0A5C5UCQ9_9GAMM|nr:hypothetical protein [Luteimonas marina]TWT23699.1 hypothetical protein FQY83_03520 [Luteimonas marina]
MQSPPHHDDESLHQIASLAARYMFADLPGEAILAAHFDEPSSCIALGGNRARVFRCDVAKSKVRVASRSARRGLFGLLPIPPSFDDLFKTLLNRLCIQLDDEIDTNGWPGAHRSSGGRGLYWDTHKDPHFKFRLMTGIYCNRSAASTINAHAIVQLALENPPAYLALNLLHKCGAVSKEDLYRIHGVFFGLRAKPGAFRIWTNRAVSVGAFGWLYKRLLVAAWRQVAEDCYPEPRSYGRHSYAAAVLSTKAGTELVALLGRSSSWPCKRW